jgi:hypothetical protein
MPLFAGPAQIEIDPGATPYATITKDMQLDDLVISLEKDVFELTNQQSSRPAGYIQTGVDITVNLSVGDMVLRNKLMALAVESTVITTTGKEKVNVSDQAGKALTSKKLLIKPYVGDTVSAAANDWLTIYKAVVISLADTEITYGLRTQQQIKIRFAAMPDSTTTPPNLKYTFGDTTA